MSRKVLIESVHSLASSTHAQDALHLHSAFEHWAPTTVHTFLKYFHAFPEAA